MCLWKHLDFWRFPLSFGFGLLSSLGALALPHFIAMQNAEDLRRIGAGWGDTHNVTLSRGYWKEALEEGMKKRSAFLSLTRGRVLCQTFGARIIRCLTRHRKDTAMERKSDCRGYCRFDSTIKTINLTAHPNHNEYGVSQSSGRRNCRCWIKTARSQEIFKINTTD